jgi:hypothetical protein
MGVVNHPQAVNIPFCPSKKLHVEKMHVASCMLQSCMHFYTAAQISSERREGAIKLG